MDNYIDSVIGHYNRAWINSPQIHLWDKGPIGKMNFDFKVLAYPPTSQREMWTYATCGMSSHILNNHPVELHMFSHKEDDTIVELLFSVAYFHKNSAQLDLNHTVNFGRAWQDDSQCTYGFISLPYLDGPELENLYLSQVGVTIKFYWLIPLLEKEVNYKIKFGAEALEEKFDQNELDYLDPKRSTVL